jgi:hypothetical protein
MSLMHSEEEIAETKESKGNPQEQSKRIDARIREPQRPRTSQVGMDGCRG